MSKFHTVARHDTGGGTAAKGDAAGTRCAAGSSAGRRSTETKADAGRGTPFSIHGQDRAVNASVEDSFEAPYFGAHVAKGDAPM